MQDHGDPAEHDGFAADTYGRGFADVYDRWYPADPATSAAVQRISALAGPDSAVLELGVGTGRLAVPLARAGHTVVGLDASEEMLEQLAGNGAGVPDGALSAHRVDLGGDDPWPPGPYSVVVAAFNLLCNLVDPLAQARLFERSAAVLRPGGHLVVETFLAAPLEHRQRHLEVREVRADGVVLIASDTEPDSGIVTGSHIELRDGEPVRLRPWRLRLTAPDELDTWAADAGLTRVAQWQDWAGTPHDPEAPATVRIGVYRAEPVGPAGVRQQGEPNGASLHGSAS